MSEQNDLPSDNTIEAILNLVTPDYSDFSLHPLAGSYSNHTQLVTIEFADKAPQQIVLRLYNIANGDCAGKARREFHSLHHLWHQGLPVPRPLYLDDEGKLFGSPAIITHFVQGKQIEASSQAQEWASKIDLVAQMLSKIHSTPYLDTVKEHLMNANKEALWFLKSGKVPDYMNQHPDGAQVWHTIAEVLASSQAVEPALIHLDYWSGNILWDKGQISALVDWEEAAYGDPAIDVAYCRMELYLEGLDEEADRFLHVYEAAVGHKLANLGLWELAASVRPMLDIEGWFQRPHMAERFRQFIARATKRATI